MKQTNIVKETFYCDVCKREVNHQSDLDKCIICGREYCWVCKFDLSNVYLMDICKECADNEPYSSYLKDRMWKVIFLNTRKRMIEHIKKLRTEVKS